MKKNYYTIFIYTAISLLEHSVFAKEFKLISLSDFGNIQEIKFQDESAPQILYIKKFHPNTSYPIPESKLIHFYALHPDSKASSRKPILRVSFKDIESDTILFLKKDKNSPNLINYELLNNDKDSFPILSTLIINLSEKPVVGKIGERIVPLLPKEQKIVSLPNDKWGAFNQKVFFAEQKSDRSISYFYASDWLIKEGEKSLCIIDFDEKSETHRLVDMIL